ncbi:hypothetical protein CCO03_08765 [Comamonas serinivorans]|uniref:Uncharacterized protein n=1 Tax=Comamonas serinivorans TaxID=1082851 RepID=A0A1Y0EMC9_9BURK|nr:phage tail assembly chaperone [Comamonas serinivorans]ARU04757.1 hypothetical protein CCO03_08765 [Comamonas serinivorans]
MAKSYKELRAQPTFTAKVPVVIPGGGVDEVELTFIYKDRQGQEEVLEAEKALTVAHEKRKTKTFETVLELEFDSLALIASGWEFAEPFTKEAVTDFLRHHRGFNIEAWKTYFSEYVPAKRGN